MQTAVLSSSAPRLAVLEIKRTRVFIGKLCNDSDEDTVSPLIKMDPGRICLFYGVVSYRQGFIFVAGTLFAALHFALGKSYSGAFHYGASCAH